MVSEVQKVLLRISEVMAATGYSRQFICDRISEGDLKVIRKGRSLRVRVSDMHDWIKRGEVVNEEDGGGDSGAVGEDGEDTEEDQGKGQGDKA